jgi:hypothetical protein
MRSEEQIPEKCSNVLNALEAGIPIFMRSEEQFDSLGLPVGGKNSALNGDVGATQGHRWLVEEVVCQVKAW